MLSVTQGPLAALRHRPIGPAVAAADALRQGYRTHAVDLEDPRGADPMAEVRDHGIAGENAYFAGLPPYHARIEGSVPDLLLRRAVVERLRAVNARLAPYDLELWVFDAWRPIALQNHFHDVWMPDRLRAMHPDWTDAQITRETGRYFATGAPGGQVDPRSPPPHFTGGAVDLTIRRATGAELFMGTIFDDLSVASNTAHFEAEPDGLAFSHHEARENRRMLYWLMIDAGFANNPTEWWHFSLGDQMWARLSGVDAAYYSAAPVPDGGPRQ